MIVYKFRCIADCKEDVFCDFMINEESNLEQLHDAIKLFFHLEGNELASFYKSNKDWEQGEEIPLIDFEENESMDTVKLTDYFDEDTKHLLYVYDYLNLWTFFIELVAMDPATEALAKPILINHEGFLPKKSPTKIFEAEKDLEHSEDEEGEDFENDKDEDYFY